MASNLRNNERAKRSTTGQRGDGTLKGLFARRPGSRRPNWRLWAFIGVVLFLVVDLLLVAIALSANDPQEAAPTSAATYDLQTRPSPSPTPSEVAPVVADPVFVADPRVLAAASESVAWRSTTGDCATTPAIIERTSDGGVTWSEIDTGRSDIRQVFAMTAVSETIVTLVGAAGDDCEVGQFRSFTAGSFWETYDAGGEATPYLDPSDSSIIHVFGNTVAAPCAAKQLVFGASFAVLCENQLQLLDDDDEWQAVEITGAVSLATNSDGVVVTVAGASDCTGISVQSLSIESPEPVVSGCLREETTPDRLTVAQSGETVWLWNSDRVFVSTDGGVTW